MDAPFVGRIRGKGRGKGRGFREFANSSSRPLDASEQAEQWEMGGTSDVRNRISSSVNPMADGNMKHTLARDIQGHLQHAIADADVLLDQSSTMSTSAQTSGPDFSFVLLLPGIPCEAHMKDALCTAEAVLLRHGANGIDQRGMNQGKFIRAELKCVRFNVFVGGSEADRLYGRARGKGQLHAASLCSSQTSHKQADRAVPGGHKQFWEKMGLSPGSRLQDHCMEILARARPEESTVRMRQEITTELQELIRAALADSECVVAGSVARETDLRITSDIDIITLLPGLPSDDQVRDATRSIEEALLRLGATGINGKRPQHSATSITVQFHGVTFDILVGGREVDPLADRPAQSSIVAHKMLAHHALFDTLPRSVRIAAVMLKWWLRDAVSVAKVIIELLACFVGRQLTAKRGSGNDSAFAVQIFVEVARLLIEWEDLHITWDHPGDAWRPYHGSCKPLITDVHDPAENVANRWTPAVWQRVARLARDALEALRNEQ